MSRARRGGVGPAGLGRGAQVGIDQDLGVWLEAVLSVQGWGLDQGWGRIWVPQCGGQDKVRARR